MTHGYSGSPSALGISPGTQLLRRHVGELGVPGSRAIDGARFGARHRLLSLVRLREPHQKRLAGQLVGPANQRSPHPASRLSKHVHPHLLRHSWMTEMLRNGMESDPALDHRRHVDPGHLRSLHDLNKDDVYDSMIRVLTATRR